MTLSALGAARAMLDSSRVVGALCWPPFASVIAVFLLGACGLAYMPVPNVVIDRLTIRQAASATRVAGRHPHRLRDHGARDRGVPGVCVPVFWEKAREMDYA